MSAERKPAKPVLITETVAGTMTWDRSIRETEYRKQKNKIHGHKLSMKCGDEVRDHMGDVGILVHKEFLYEDTPSGPGHDVWLLTVQYKARLKTFSNPSAISLLRPREKL